MENKKAAQSKQESLPLASSIDFPWATPANSSKVEAAVAEAKKAILAAQAQLACLKIQDFFEAHPQAVMAELSGVWDSNECDGCFCKAMARVECVEGMEVGEEEIKQWGEEFAAIFEGWADDFEWAEFSSGNAFQRAGKLLLPNGAFDEWMARVEREEIGEEAGLGSRRKGSMRMWC